MLSLITLPAFNISDKMAVIQRYTDLANPGWIEPVLYVFNPLKDWGMLMVILFTMGITYIRTNNLAALAFTMLLFSGLVMAYVPTLGAKLAYLIIIFTFAGVLYRIFGKR